MKKPEIVERVSLPYENQSMKFMDRCVDFSKQYSNLYLMRWRQMEPLLIKRIQTKWNNEYPIYKLHKLSGIPKCKCIVIGTLFKEQKLKPSILKQLAAEANAAPQPLRQNCVDESDKLYVEDELQRYEVIGCLQVNAVVTGITCALLGVDNGLGRFVVDDCVFAGFRQQIPRPQLNSDVFILLLSGLDFINLTDYMVNLQLFIQWLSGLGETIHELDAARVARVIIAGNSIRNVRQMAKPSISILSKVPEAADTIEAVHQFDTYLAQLCQLCEIDVMPGENDPTNHVLPQMPMHYCVFPQAATYGSMHQVSNPYVCSVGGGHRLMGTSGQPIRDILRYTTDIVEPLDAMELCLKWNHLAPTAPDTLGCYPYCTEDPFVIDQCPHVFFAGNQPTFDTKMIKGEDGQTVAQIKESIDGQPCTVCNNCTKGFEAHVWRKCCKHCKCPRFGHEVVAEHGAKPRLGLGITHDGLDARSLGYTFIPTGLTFARQVDQFYSLLPPKEVPKLGTKGEIVRQQRLVNQLPKQDLTITACKFVESTFRRNYQDFVQTRNDVALDVGCVKQAPPNSMCYKCHVSITGQQLSVVAARLGTTALWHPACFVCTTCGELLVDLAYCVHNEKIYCERHYAEMLMPRCEGCDELIFSGEYTKAANKDWHGQHFCCWQCDESLTGQRYVLRDDHPYCVSCYESVFANNCEKCNRIIGIDSKLMMLQDLSYKDKHWHEACFLCTTCGESLVDKQFGSKADRIYCGRCYDEQFASRCDGCHDVFRAGTKKMEYKTRQWHEKCFCCCVCKTPIGTQSFIPREQEIFCAKCYEEKFATRCIKCNKVITSGGVTYKNEPWHRECFTCTNCSRSLAGERFTSRNEKPYCAECFGELFAKRCYACKKPITGIGGTKFISFEDRHWHNDCFFCALCRTSLVGRGFITDQEDIICPDCAKQKLM